MYDTSHSPGRGYLRFGDEDPVGRDDLTAPPTYPDTNPEETGPTTH